MVQNSLIVSFHILFIFVLLSRSNLGAAVSAEVEESVKANSTHLKYIGDFASPESVRGRIQFKTSLYFLSQNSATFDTANNDCKSFIGDDAHLLYIETQEELAEVNKFIQESDDVGLSYWVGGRYDTIRDTFVWGNDVEIGPWAPWDQGQPDTTTPNTRVYVRTVGDTKFRTQFNTVSTKYICETKVEEGTETSMSG